MAVRRRGEKWIVDYYDATRKRRWETFRTKKEAVAAEAKYAVAIKEGTHVRSNDKRTVGDAYKSWLALCVEGSDNKTGRPLRPTTQALYGMTYRVHLEERWGKRPLISVGAEEVSTWREEQLEKHGPKTVLNALQLLGSLFRHARRFKWVIANPVEDVRKPKYRGKVKAFTMAEVDRLCEAAGPDMKLLIEVAAGTGLRFGELTGLRWCDVDLAAGVVRPVRQFTHGAWSDLKTDNAKRRLKLPKDLLEMLTARLAVLDGNVAKIHAGPDERLVFPGQDGKPIDYFNWRNRVWLPLLAKTGPDDKHPNREPVAGTFHMLRHTFCTVALSRGVSTKAVSVMAGHASSAFTMDQYADALPDEMAAAADKVAEALFEARSSRMVAAAKNAEQESAEVLDLNGGPCWIRTSDQLVKSQLLYRLS